jgi:type 1 glutamine amidotransferase
MSKACFFAVIVVSWVLGPVRQGEAQVTDRQARQIREAAPQQSRVAPKQPRRVLIWNTPYKDTPHRGFTIPQGAFAMKTLGEKTGAFEGVISDDQTLLLPENLQQFDAIVMNNSSGPWTTPTDEAMKKFVELGQGDDKQQIQETLRKSFFDWLASGRGMVAYHYSIGACRDWPELKNVFGAMVAGHPWNEEIGVRVE